MLEGLAKLLELQHLDDELVARQTEHEGLPARRQQIEEQRTAASSRLSESKQALQDAELGMREAENALADREALLAKLEGQQFQVKSNDAYTALLHEMEHAKEAISEHETKILESMEAIESAREKLDTADREVGAELAGLEAEEKTLAEREKQLEVEIERLTEQRSMMGPGIDPELLRQYERIAKRRRPAVVVVTSELCGGCRVNIPPQTFIEILRGTKVMTCGNCNRILLHAEKIGAEAGSS